MALYNATSTQVTISTDFIVYPNPVKDILYLKLPTGISRGEFVVFNSLGQKVMHQQIFQNEKKVEVTFLSSGVYMFEFSANSTILQGKIMKE